MTEGILKSELRRDAILLTGKGALVTGGGAGIGRGIALGLAEFGADVAIVDVDSHAAEQVSALIQAKGRRAMTLVVDVTDRDGMRSAIAHATETLGAIDVLVNNAGGTRPIKLHEMTDKQADRQIDLNLRSLFAITQAVAMGMIARERGGSIINIASIEGQRAAPSYAIYAACKAAVLNFTRTAALELAEYGIRVNALAPDLVPTERMIRFAPGLLSPAGQSAQKRYIPLGRPGTLDDCAGAAVFLASSMASYITGVTLNVDGGTWASSGWTRDDAGGWRLFS